MRILSTTIITFCFVISSFSQTTGAELNLKTQKTDIKNGWNKGG